MTAAAATVIATHNAVETNMDVPVTHDRATELVWPSDGVTRVPFRVFSDPQIYAEEQKRLFRGPIWNFLCLEIEIQIRATGGLPRLAKRPSS
jgi:hypothetical protein